jgi:hypothetical protein
MEKPPLGLMPKHIHEAKRKQEILEAVMRYMNRNKAVPIEWVEEYNELVRSKAGDKDAGGNG